jgi:hypothetical protein
MDNREISQGKHGTQSLPLPMDAPELLKVRIIPTEFARLLGVSKQTVSIWIKTGKITINPLDGRLDPQQAFRQLLRNTDPGKLRVRLLRQAVDEVNDLRQAVADGLKREESLEAQLAQARARIGYLEYAWADSACMDEYRRHALIERWPELRALPDESAWRAALDRIDYDAANHCCAEAPARAWDMEEGGGGALD